MATVLSESGQYLIEKTNQNARNIILTAYAGACVVMLGYGLYLGFQFWGSKSSWQLSLLVSLLVFAGFALLSRIVERKMDEFEKARRNFTKGAAGETIVAKTIGHLPDD